MNEEINYNFVSAQIYHWLSCPPNGYLGSDYGIDLKTYLQKPMSSFAADEIIAKMRADIPILSMLPLGSINIFSRDDGIDGKNIYIQVVDAVFKAVIPENPVKLQGDNATAEGGQLFRDGRGYYDGKYTRGL